MNRITVVLETDRVYESWVLETDATLREIHEMQRENEEILADLLGLERFNVATDYLTFTNVQPSDRIPNLKEQFTAALVRERLTS